MQPIFGFLLFGAAVFIVALIAHKRGRSALLLALAMIAGGFGLVVLVSNFTGGNGMLAGLAAFLAPVAGLVFATSAKSSQDLAVEQGSHGAYVKCRFCAEPVRREAIKCKHCGSDLTEPAATG